MRIVLGSREWGGVYIFYPQRISDRIAFQIIQAPFSCPQLRQESPSPLYDDLLETGTELFASCPSFCYDLCLTAYKKRNIHFSGSNDNEIWQTSSDVGAFG